MQANTQKNSHTRNATGTRTRSKQVYVSVRNIADTARISILAVEPQGPREWVVDDEAALEVIVKQLKNQWQNHYVNVRWD